MFKLYQGSYTTKIHQKNKPLRDAMYSSKAEPLLA